MCKKFKFDPTKKWYMHKQATLPNNDTHKLLWDFDIQTDYLINNNNKKKENLQNCPHAVPADHRIKLKVCKKNDKYIDLSRELEKKTMEHEGDRYTNCDWCFWYSN